MEESPFRMLRWTTLRSRRGIGLSWDVGVATPSAHPAPRGMIQWNPDEILAVGHDVTHAAQRSLCLAHSTKLPAALVAHPPDLSVGTDSSRQFRTFAVFHRQLSTNTDARVH